MSNDRTTALQRIEELALCATATDSRDRGDWRDDMLTIISIAQEALQQPVADSQKSSPEQRADSEDAVAAAHNRVTVDCGALQLALSVLRRAGKAEIADSLVQSCGERGVAATEAQADPVVMQYLALTDAMRYEAGPQMLSAEEYAAALYADAMRYRWLRDRTRGERGGGGFQRFALLSPRPVSNVMQGAVCQHLDDAIDAEIRAAAPAATEPSGEIDPAPAAVSSDSQTAEAAGGGSVPGAESNGSLKRPVAVVNDSSTDGASHG